MKYVCKNCGKSYDTDTKLWRCECGGAFWLDREEEGRFTKADIRSDEYSMWRYEKAYPMKRADLAARGITKITEDSSGNAGASVATYAAKAGIECNVYVPASTSEGKVTQVIASGAKLHKIPGLRDLGAVSFFSAG